MEEQKENLENLENQDATEQPITEAEVQEENTDVNPLQAQINEVNDKYLRLAAEFDNYRKRVAKEKLDLIKNASEDLIISLLDTLDDFERATEQIEKTDNLPAIKEGIHLVFQKMKKTLQSKGLEDINSIDETFNVDLHEALTEIPAASEEQVGKVVDQISKGYKLNDKVIRHAKVVVGK